AKVANTPRRPVSGDVAGLERLVRATATPRFLSAGVANDQRRNRYEIAKATTCPDVATALNRLPRRSDPIEGGGMDEPKGDISLDGQSVWDTDHWEPLRLTAAQVVRAVEASWGLRAQAPLRYLAEGLMNHSWQLSAKAGEFVVRVVRPDIDANQL